eukprot:gnl/Chilomastix_cuspidata/117.p1 GENE.gnl/Chilomastix_cuspidata/117~~gnl/Chilomastix_cuspidata/117.p1  ORF type:complete len:503 (+),score=185.92 gnl/Chilomastix_cuspidata/117:763-2271(+)
MGNCAPCSAPRVPRGCGFFSFAPRPFISVRAEFKLIPMKHRFSLVLFVALIATAFSLRRHYFKETGRVEKAVGDSELLFWFDEQILDHFDHTNTEVWSQRYYVNDTNYLPGGPIFLMIGGEGEETESSVNGHYYYNEFAKELNGMCVCLEHRFYGQSFPTEDSSTENLRYLTSQQALADLAYFHDWFEKQRDLEGAQWILVGGSYSGNLAAWARLRYPHLFAGALASSAPVHAVYNFDDYLMVIANSSGAECAAVYEEATAEVDNLISTEEGREELGSIFNICEGMKIGESHDEIANFYTMITDPICGVVQYAAGDDITNMCDVMLNGGGSAFENYVQFINDYYGGCFDPTYTTWIAQLTNVSKDSVDSSSRSWFYQTCVEFGYFQTGDNSPFSNSIDLEYFDDTCRDAYGIETRVDTDFTNVFYGALNLRGQNIYLANGIVDPWHALGITSDPVEPSNVATLMEGTSHCADMYMPADTDPSWLQDTRDDQLAHIKAWLGYE